MEQCQVSLFDDTHAPQGSFQIYALGGDDNDLLAEVKKAEDSVISGLPALWTAEFLWTDASTVYWLLDKDNFIFIWKTLVSFFGPHIFLDNPQIFSVLINPKQSPRYTGWKDLDGVARMAPPSDKHGAKGNFSGAGTLVQAFLLLPAYADQLRKDGRVRDAGIVMYAYNQVLSRAWSITKALDYLRANNLP